MILRRETQDVLVCDTCFAEWNPALKPAYHFRWGKRCCGRLQLQEKVITYVDKNKVEGTR